MPRALSLLALAGLVACAPRAVTTPEPNMDPGRIIAPPPPPPPPPPPKQPLLPPADASARGLMPLVSTNVWQYRQASPTRDGRGVLIAILDSGVDPTVPGLVTTSTGDPKILDVRDFSGEGRVRLEPAAVADDSIAGAGASLAGMGRVAAINATGPYFIGVLDERPLGTLPAADLDGDGANDDRLAVVVTRASDGWVVFADTDRDGSLIDERPVHDYRATRETFGWHPRGRESPLGIAANIADSAGVPVLDLVFDTSGHGTHVAGIAAGAGLYGVRGFDGVAPGAQLIALKIANNAHGGISVTGAMLRAMDYAIGFARQRGFPLVMNLSFGVGNEREGAARIDALVDSVLTANPDVVLVTSAGNDGPGLSTMGFPASAGLAITVGATLPAPFIGPAAGGDVVAFFSARGGELTKPDIMAPGIAYSSVPRWSVGDEVKNGTSMASPHVAGAVGLLMGAARAEGRTVGALQIKQAIVASARPLPGATAVDEGPGLLDLISADGVLRRLPAVAAMRARVGTVAAGAGYSLQASSIDSALTITLDGGLPGPLRLRSDQPWLTAPPTVSVSPPRTRVAASIRATGLGPGLHVGSVTGWASDTTIGPLFRVTATVVVPVALTDSILRDRASLPPAGVRRVFIPADTARPFRVSVATASIQQRAIAFLHEPGGQPNRGGTGLDVGAGEDAAEFEIDGRDLVPGVYEVVASALPAGSASVEIAVERSPFAFGAARAAADTVAMWIENRSAAAAAGAVMFGVVGAERRVAFAQRGSAERRVTVQIPRWASRLVVDLTVPRDQWPRFTDLGLSVVDGRGQILETEPLNYHTGRLAMELDPALAGQEVAIVIGPGFADPNASGLWEGDLVVKLYAETPRLVETAGSADFELKPGGRETRRLSLGKLPWALGDGFFPLGNMVIDARGTLWGRESPLPERLPPPMR